MERFLGVLEQLPDGLDHEAVAAEVDGALATIVSVTETIVGAERYTSATTPCGRHRTLIGKQVGSGGDQGDCRMGCFARRGGGLVLVNAFFSFQFKGRLARRTGRRH